MPAPSSTLKCFVTAWRVIAEPSVKRAIEYEVPSLSLPTSVSRVASPKAANAMAGSIRARLALRVCVDMFGDILHLDRPASAVPSNSLPLDRSHRDAK